MKKLENLKPERVFHYFEEICGIPHGSGDTEKISNYCVEFAKKHNLEYIKEDIGNVIIKKPATKGKEGCPTIILQGHLDMVCEKITDCNIDFKNDGIDIYVEDGFVRARGTTLGADNGIAVAMCLALLEADDIINPNLEVLFTVDEETGMYGAQALDGTLLKGRTLINIDSEEEGIFTVSCAGGVRAELSVPVEIIDNTKPCLKITVEGLMGGHSGVDIDKGRMNSNKVAASFLKTLSNFNLVAINGGLKDNAIPVYTEIIIATDNDIKPFADKFVRNNKTDCDSGLIINVESVEKNDTCFTTTSTDMVIDFLNGVPNGIIKWSDDIEGLVETSLNLGVLKTQEKLITASFALRSSINDDKLKLLNRLRDYVNKFNGNFIEEGHYPAWEYKKESFLREKMCSVYEKVYGSSPKVVAIHAGLECGLLSEKLSGLDAVSIGPDMMDIHTPRERLSIKSTERIYKYLIQLLGEI